MRMFNIDDAGKMGLEALPETGMGFQFVEATVMGELKRLLVFNSEKAIDLSGIELSVSNDPAVVLRNGIRIVELLKSDVRQTIVMSPAPHSFKLLSMRIPPLHALAGGTMSSMPVTAALPSSLVKHVKLKAPRAFHRFFAFTPDRRVNPLTGDFLPGTYASPASEVPFLPTGFAVVGRLALPNNLPASHHFEISAAIGTDVDFGTVAPAFGQAGGGVEAFFSKGAKNASAPPAVHPDLADE
jgi:hypothetical protein